MFELQVDEAFEQQCQLQQDIFGQLSEVSDAKAALHHQLATTKAAAAASQVRYLEICFF